MNNEKNLISILQKMKNKKIVFFGASNMGKVIINNIPIKIDYFIDNDVKKQGQKIENINIYDINKLLSENKNEILIIITTMYYEEVSKQLNEAGFVENDNYINGEIIFDAITSSNNNKYANEEIIELDDNFYNKMIYIKPLLIEYFNKAKFYLMKVEGCYDEQHLKKLRTEIYNEIKNITVKNEAEKTFLEFLIYNMDSFFNNNYYRQMSYIEQIYKYTDSIKIKNIWEMCACQGTLSLMLKALGNKVTVSDRNTPSIKSFAYGGTNWLRNEIFQFDRNFDFTYNTENMNLISSFNDEIKFDIITTNANLSIYTAAKSKIRSKKNIQEELIKEFKPIIMILNKGGIFQSRGEGWYIDLNNMDERIKKLNELAVKLEKVYGVEILEVGKDPVPHPHKSGDFSLQLVFRK